MTDRPRPRVIIATSMSGARWAIGPVVTDHSLDALRSAIERAGWTAGEAVPYLSAAGFRQAVAR